MQGTGERCAIVQGAQSRRGRELEARGAAAESQPIENSRGEAVLAYGAMAISGGVVGAVIVNAFGAAILSLTFTVAGCCLGWLARGTAR